jgi:hypothetical protein
LNCKRGTRRCDVAGTRARAAFRGATMPLGTETFGMRRPFQPGASPPLRCLTPRSTPDSPSRSTPPAA